ncbi:hypothetical protein MTR67_006203 [Solanum verrucosum]|uniref:Reverse transcriptase zinc-binding domain-containing protein n=1 Tax=Solanum verrucosum TaxID=315347 RepID=A0AAF0TD92_SOLVR|nr:hypothetical protein MTR67_006203 [Solanum verrucosum]
MCSVWKTIRRMWPDFSAKVTFRVGNGLKTSFWNETWLGDVNLRILFPDLYIISLQQNDTIAQMWSPQGWDLMFRRALNDWEVGRVADLLHALNLFPGTVTEPDKPVWRLHSRGVFTVKSCYWERNTNHFLTTVWPWKLIWKIKVPLKVACFTWLVIRRACLTHEVLQRRGIQICSKCYMCGQKTEVNGHLFLHCKIATDLWNMFVFILGVNWTMPRTTFEVLTHWQGIGKRGSKEDWWKNIPACIWWTLWKEMNGRCYEGKALNLYCPRYRCSILGMRGGVEVPHRLCEEKILFYGLRQSSAHELDFGVELGPNFIIKAVAQGVKQCCEWPSPFAFGDKARHYRLSAASHDPFESRVELLRDCCQASVSENYGGSFYIASVTE